MTLYARPADVPAHAWTWGLYFQPAEFACKHSGKILIAPEFMNRLLALRLKAGTPFRIASGYRDPSHPVERAKGGRSGAHTTGRAADIALTGIDALVLVEQARAFGFTGIGVQQAGDRDGRFIHLDDVASGLPRPAFWSY